MNSTEKHSNYLAPLGYVWGIALAIAGTGLFFFLDPTTRLLAGKSFMKIHPLYSGGEIVRVESTPDTEWRIHRPVFDGLVSDRAHGFIQIDVIGKNQVTKTRIRDIDYDGDGRADFQLSIPVKAAGMPAIKAYSPRVTGLENDAPTREGWIVRVGLDK